MSDRKRILIVDDNAQFIELAKIIFSGDFNVYTAGDGLEGLRLAKEILPDLILLDVDLPVINGIDFSRRLLADRETSGIPIIVITASAYNSITESLLRNEQNVKVFMTKLSPVETILEKVAGLLK